MSAEGDGAAVVGETPKSATEREDLRRQAQERRNQQRKALAEDLRLSDDDDELFGVST